MNVSGRPAGFDAPDRFLAPQPRAETMRRIKDPDSQAIRRIKNEDHRLPYQSSRP